jgi:hypothetical protein
VIGAKKSGTFSTVRWLPTTIIVAAQPSEAKATMLIGGWTAIVHVSLTIATHLRNSD